jgi:hypothetical protein
MHLQPAQMVPQHRLSTCCCGTLSTRKCRAVHNMAHWMAHTLHIRRSVCTSCCVQETTILERHHSTKSVLTVLTCGVPSSSVWLGLFGEVGVLGYSCDSACPIASPSAAAVAGAAAAEAASPCKLSSGGTGLAIGVPFVPLPCLELHIPMLNIHSSKPGATADNPRQG